MKITAVLLSTEPNGFDGLVRDYGETHRYDLSGIDADPSRENARLGFSHFSGVDPSLDSFRVPIGNRRRFLILDTTTPTNSLLFITNDYRSAKAPEVMAAMDSVRPVMDPPELNPYAAWIGTFDLDKADSATSCDPDMDGLNNAQEFYFNTNPTDALSRPHIRIEGRPSAGLALHHTHRRDHTGVDAWIEVSDDLVNWDRPDIPNEAITVEPQADGSVHSTLWLQAIPSETPTPTQVFRIAVGVR